MEETGRDARVNASAGTVPPEPEAAPAAPRFDDKSIQHARAAVPLGPRGVMRSRSSGLVVLCLAAALVGALVGGVALTLYQREGGKASTPEAKPTGAVGGTAPVEPAGAEGATVEPAGAEATDVAATAEGGAAEAAELPGAEGGEEGGQGGEEAALRGALGRWIEATNARDVGRQMSFYGERVGAFYLSRNVTREAVRAEKDRVFGRASSVEIQAGEPEISLSRDGRTAVMRFRKRYHIAGEGRERRGEVLQELRWRRTEQGWKIVGERDLRVIR
jgi:ketosteroid isomerase-like protein